MNRFLLPLLLLSSVAWGQNTVGTIAYDPDLYTEGYTMIYPHNQNRAMLALDRQTRGLLHRFRVCWVGLVT